MTFDMPGRQLFASEASAGPHGGRGPLADRTPWDSRGHRCPADSAKAVKS